MNLSNLRRLYRDTKTSYSTVGDYPQFAYTADGAALCIPCMRAERSNVVAAVAWQDEGSGWYIEGIAANWADPRLYCDHCAARIESAYADAWWGE